MRRAYKIGLSALITAALMCISYNLYDASLNAANNYLSKKARKIETTSQMEKLVKEGAKKRGIHGEIRIEITEKETCSARVGEDYTIKIAEFALDEDTLGHEFDHIANGDCDQIKKIPYFLKFPVYEFFFEPRVVAHRLMQRFKN